MMFQFVKLLFQNPLVRSFRTLWKKITAGWKVHLEKPVPEEELAYSREGASIPSFSFFFLLSAASVIATLGLIANSTAVIIGAMIVAPLMNPILSGSFAIVTANWTLYKRSIVTVALGAATTILISFLISYGLPVDIVGSEVVARTSPNLLDLGIAIAAGAAGSFSLTRKSIASSIAGVAIAVALVPPLCVTGMGLGIGEGLEAQIGSAVISNFDVSAGSFLLFIVNLAGITFTACLVFLSQSYGNLYKAFQTIVIWLLIIGLLCGPLTGSMKEFVIANRIRLEIRAIRKEGAEISKLTQIRHIDVRLEETTAYVSILGSAPQGVVTDEYLETSEKRIFDTISKMGIKSMNIKIRIYPVEIKEYQNIID
jgi:uncharacterized hydrophobic protein (TIGR00271 family)